LSFLEREYLRPKVKGSANRVKCKINNENYSESIEKYFESNEREYWQHVILISYPTLIEVILNSY